MQHHTHTHTHTHTHGDKHQIIQRDVFHLGCCCLRGSVLLMASHTHWNVCDHNSFCDHNSPEIEPQQPCPGTEETASLCPHCPREASRCSLTTGLLGFFSLTLNR